MFKNSKKAEIFILSILILYTELLLVRWISTEISIFSYLQNSILISCFLGLGIGCLKPDRHKTLESSLFNFTIIAVLLSIPFLRKIMQSLSQMLSVFHDFLTWNHLQDADLLLKSIYIFVGFFLTFYILSLIWKIMLPLGSRLSDLIESSDDKLLFYTINIFGSLIGVWIFGLFSYLSLDPAYWLAALSFVYIIYILNFDKLNKKFSVMLMLILALPIATSYFDNSIKTIWSPYQKLVLSEKIEDKTEYVLSVNNVGFQQIQNNSLEHIKNNYPLLYRESGLFSQYDIPYKFTSNPEDILIVGAGTGNDIAGAIRNTNAQITAIEIDSAIIDLGIKYHPEKPFQSERVKFITTDARESFMSLDKKFDIIVFGLLDSHTTASLTNARLDHFVYTIESLTQVKKLLKQDGILALIFEPQREYVSLRLAQSLEFVFNMKPLILKFPTTELGWGGELYLIGDLAKVEKALNSDLELHNYINTIKQDTEKYFKDKVKLTNDNWPYLYIEKPSIPSLFVFLGLIFLLLWSDIKKKILKDFNYSSFIANPNNLMFFLMGCGFSLFEVYGINQSAILLGSTWIVNTFVISTVLIVILIANYFVAKIKIEKGFIKYFYITLLCLLLMLYKLNFSDYLFYSFWTKVFILFSCFGVPFIFCSIVFATHFSNSNNIPEALGSNMLGCLIGRILQFFTFLTGIKSLVIVIAFAYFLCFILFIKNVDNISCSKFHKRS